jgi:hypothetical protein
MHQKSQYYQYIRAMASTSLTELQSSIHFSYWLAHFVLRLRNKIRQTPVHAVIFILNADLTK